MAASAFGIGVYTAPEAARLVGMNAKTLRRWILGYEYSAGDEDRRQPALWRPQYAPDEDEVLLGFRDVVEARIVNALRAMNIGLPTIRMCLERAREIVGDERPLSTRQFKTDGRSIFLDMTQGLSEGHLVDLKRRQNVFKRIVEPSLSGLEFGDTAAERWFLIPGKRSIVADPEHAFGQPSIAGHGMTTSRVVQAVKAEGSVQKVAKLYELKPSAVRDALLFEEHRGLRRAA